MASEGGRLTSTTGDTRPDGPRLAEDEPARHAIDLLRLRSRYSTRAVLSTSPSLYLPLMERKYATGEDKIVDGTTEVVIEGFPRSANTFALVAFQVAQGRPVKAAHHLHAAAQIKRGAQMRIPTLVLIRDPLEAVLSHLVRQPGVTPRQGMRNWVRFYRAANGLRGRVVVATFEEVTTDFGAVIRRLNARYGTTFAEFEHTPENVEWCFRQIEERNRARYSRVIESLVARPSTSRDSAKEALRSRFRAPSMRPLVRSAYRLHASLTR